MLRFVLRGKLLLLEFGLKLVQYVLRSGGSWFLAAAG
jgi:hypothetical protein